MTAEVAAPRPGIDQVQILSVSFADLARALGIPADHAVEAVRLQEATYHPPGLLLVVRGPAMHFHPANSPLYIEPIAVIDGYWDERRAAAQRTKL